jgi:hypothetical protein
MDLSDNIFRKNNVVVLGSFCYPGKINLENLLGNT